MRALVSITVVCLVLISEVGIATADELETSALGPAREIPRTRSADRDAPAFNYLLLPRPTLTAFGELGLFSLGTNRWTARLGFVGGLEIESNNETSGSRFLLDVGDIRFWRGYNGFTASFHHRDLSRLICATCTAEASLMIRHESEHYTGSNRGGDGTDYSDRSQVGDFVKPEVALAAHRGALWGSIRGQVKLFLPGRSSYTIAPALDLHGRLDVTDTAAAFVSLFLETQRGGLSHEPRGERSDIGVHPLRYPNSNVVRVMTGAAFVSRLGDIMVYLYGTQGHRKGLAVFENERVLGLGFRLALWSLPK